MSPTHKKFAEMEKKLTVQMEKKLTAQIEKKIVAQMTPILERRFQKTGKIKNIIEILIYF